MKYEYINSILTDEQINNLSGVEFYCYDGNIADLEEMAKEDDKIVVQVRFKNKQNQYYGIGAPVYYAKEVQREVSKAIAGYE